MDDVQGGAQNCSGCFSENMISMPFGKALESVGGILLSEKKTENLDFAGVATDSRKIGKNFIFFPLVGSQDGHGYIDQAIENGATVVFVNKSFSNGQPEKISEINKKGITIISVEHTMHALQQLAACYVLMFPNLIRIGITGSSGKTTTKEIAVKVLSQKYNVVYNEGNLNSETGLPLSVFKIRKEHQAGVFEMGMNRKGEISEIAGVLKPQYAIITNIGTAHVGILGSRQNIAAEKKRIFENFSGNCTGYVPEDDDFADFFADSEGTIKKFSFDQVSEIEDLGLKGTRFVLGGERIDLPLCGRHNLKNTLPVIALAMDLGLTPKQIKKGIESVEPMFGRNQIFEGNVTVIQDCYNANPDSMAASIDFVSDLKWNGKKIFVLADMLELGKEEKEEHEKTVSQAAMSNAGKIILLGSLMSGAVDSLEANKEKVISFGDASDASVEKAFDAFRQFCIKGDLVLLKGSRGMALERFTKKIMEFYGMQER